MPNAAGVFGKSYFAPVKYGGVFECIMEHVCLKASKCLIPILYILSSRKHNLKYRLYDALAAITI